MPFVYSTLTADQEYTAYEQGPEGAPQRAVRSVFVKGGANVADSHFLTPRGVVTSITDEEEKLLVSCDAFKQHMKNGYVTIEKKRAESVEQVTSNMQGRDKSAPITPNDLEAEGKKATAGKVK